MRIVLDLQGAQSDSRFRGIGRYSLALARAIAQNAGPHEVWIALSNRFPDSIDSVYCEFSNLIPRERVRLFELPGPIAEVHLPNTWRIHAAELLREKFLTDLHPDVVHISTSFEGLHNEVCTSVARFDSTVPTAATLYDLIPLLRPDDYLSDPIARRWYMRHGQHLRRADLLLAISESSRQEAIGKLKIDPSRIVNISAGLQHGFGADSISFEERLALLNRCGIQRSFILCAATVEPHKNLEGLIKAFTFLPENIRSSYQLAVAGKIRQEDCEHFVKVGMENGLKQNEILFTGYVADEDLRRLYSMCSLFVLPSRHEGFGLPALEAMACGAPVIGSNSTSVPEIINRMDALFDPGDPRDIATRIVSVLSDPEFQINLREWGLKRAKEFTWENSAKKALRAFENLHAEKRENSTVSLNSASSRRPLLAYVAPLFPERAPDADYCGRIVPDLSRHYEVICIVEKPDAMDRRISCEYPIRDFGWFRQNGHRFDRILYRFFDSPSCKEFFSLSTKHPGIVLFQDFHLGSLCMRIEKTESNPGGFQKALYESHGFAALKNDIKNGSKQSITTYPCNGSVLRDCIGAIVSSEESISQALNWYGQSVADRIRRAPLEIQESNPEHSSKVYRDLIEGFYAKSSTSREQRLIEGIVYGVTPASPSDADLAAIATSIAANRPRFGHPQILLDVTNISRSDAHTGIQRVTRAILLDLLSSPPPNYRIEPVCAEGEGFVYARQFTCRFIGITDIHLTDDPIETAPGDIFLGLEWGADTIPGLKQWLIQQRYRGIRIVFTVYDLLAVLRPDFFSKEIAPLAESWINTVAEVADGLVCISRTTADDLCDWISKQRAERKHPLQIGYFHLGADLRASLPTRGLSPDSAAITSRLAKCPTFLMVGTVEPRKGHRQALEAMEILWAKGIEANLIIVGKQGWNMEDLAARVAQHPERDKHLAWLQSISDEMLEQLYQNANALLAASEGEGFGLPLIEAAQYGIPIIVRDIPVFREVAGDHAYYFSGGALGLAAALQDWLSLGENVPSSKNLPWLTWRQSTQEFLDVILGGKWYKTSPSN
jgi:glycosyltransferase involved in cell wall biosynthesis